MVQITADKKDWDELEEDSKTLRKLIEEEGIRVLKVSYDDPGHGLLSFTREELITVVDYCLVTRDEEIKNIIKKLNKLSEQRVEYLKDLKKKDEELVRVIKENSKLIVKLKEEKDKAKPWWRRLFS